MRILYIHQYFATPKGSTGTRSYEFARRWTAKGHKVTMLTATAALTMEDLAGVHGLFFKRLTIDGIDVFALSIPYRQQMGIMARCLSFVGFVVVSSFMVLFMKKPAIIEHRWQNLMQCGKRSITKMMSKRMIGNRNFKGKTTIIESNCL